MDVAFFLRERIQFIRQFYLNGVGPFELRKDKIEKEEEPFIPSYSEDGEPPYQLEWQEAEDSIQVLGYTCLSMLSSSLKLYFATVERIYGFRAQDEFKRVFKDEGFIHGYSSFFLKNLGINFELAPCDFPLLEEIVLIRNAFEHPSDIFYFQMPHPSRVAKSPNRLFCREIERKVCDEGNVAGEPWLAVSPLVYTDQERLFNALDNVLKFCEWFENELTNWRHPKEPCGTIS